MRLRNDISGSKLQLMGCFGLCIAILLPTFCPAYVAGQVVGKKDLTLQAIHPIGLIDLFYTEASHEELPQREAESEVELVLGVNHPRPAREPKRDRPLSLRALRALIENHRHLHARLPLAEHSLRYGNGLAAHCRC